MNVNNLLNSLLALHLYPSFMNNGSQGQIIDNYGLLKNIIFCLVFKVSSFFQDYNHYFEFE